MRGPALGKRIAEGGASPSRAGGNLTYHSEKAASGGKIRAPSTFCRQISPLGNGFSRKIDADV
jgi:hypothetical protein